MTLLTVTEVMQQTKLSESAAYSLMHRLGAGKIGKSLRLRKSKLDKYLREFDRCDSTSVQELGTSRATTTTERRSDGPGYAEAPVSERAAGKADEPLNRSLALKSLISRTEKAVNDAQRRSRKLSSTSERP